jgi:hypothetical protein
MKNSALKTLDSCINETLLPVLEAHGFKRKSLRIFERQGLSPGTIDVIEIRLGLRSIRGFFAINARIVEEGKEDIPWKVVGRLGTWPFSLMRLPQILLFAPITSFLMPFCWVMLFTDCWWRYSRFKSYTNLAVIDAKWLFIRQALPKFEAIHRKNEN